MGGRNAFIALLLAAVAAAGMWFYTDFILVPQQKADAALNHHPRGNLSDLYPRWLGSRELILRGRDPYGDDVTREIQAGYYGRVLDPARPGDPKDQQAFAYPVYVALLLAPTVRLPFPVVQQGFRWLLVLITAATIPLWLRLLDWKLPWTAQLAWVVFILGSYPAVQGIKLQQLTLLVCGLLAACAAALAGGHLIASGFLLALATIKPQLAGIIALWLAVWVLSDWRRRQLLAWSFLGTLALLFLGSELLLPGWVSRFRNAASAYWQYTGGGKSVLDVALGPGLGKGAALLMLVIAAWLCWKWRRDAQGTPGFAQAFALVIALSLVLIPTYAPYNQLLLLPGLMLIVRSVPLLWTRGRLSRLFLVMGIITVVWPWIAALVLDLALLRLPHARVESSWWLPFYTSLAIPVAVLGLAMMAAQSLPENHRLQR